VGALDGAIAERYGPTTVSHIDEADDGYAAVWSLTPTLSDRLWGVLARRLGIPVGIVLGAAPTGSSSPLGRTLGNAGVQLIEHHCDRFELGPDLKLGEDLPDVVVDCRQRDAAKLGDSGGTVAVDE